MQLCVDNGSPPDWEYKQIHTDMYEEDLAFLEGAVGIEVESLVMGSWSCVTFGQ